LDDLTSDSKIQFELRHQLSGKRLTLSEEAKFEVMCELIGKLTHKKLGHAITDR
jgi:hypothetical protein